MSLKMHFLHLHLEFFPENFRAVNDEQSERFHQDIQAMEERCQGVWNEGITSDLCQILYHGNSTHSNKWKFYAKYFKTFLELVLIAVLSGSQVESNYFAMLLLNKATQNNLYLSYS